MELLGKIPHKIIAAGKYSREFFSKKGNTDRLASGSAVELSFTLSNEVCFLPFSIISDTGLADLDHLNISHN